MPVSDKDAGFKLSKERFCSKLSFDGEKLSLEQVNFAVQLCKFVERLESDYI